MLSVEECLINMLTLRKRGTKILCGYTDKFLGWWEGIGWISGSAFLATLCQKCYLWTGIRNHCVLLTNKNMLKQDSCQNGQLSLTLLPWCELLSVTMVELMFRFYIWSKVNLIWSNYKAIITAYFSFSLHQKVV